MKKYITKTADTCWRDSLGCLLEISPDEIPDFVKLHKYKYMDATRKWLAQKWKKGLVFIPSKNFMESGLLRNNESGGPLGYSIGLLSMVDDRANHAVICYDGKLYWDNGSERSQEYDQMVGYYIVYDLEPRLKRAGKRKKPKKVSESEKP